jgi:soluble lytic murein transglycosylase-like protein
MAKQLSGDGHARDFARYPVPNWQPEGGFRIDPMLMFSLMRQESGFRSSAVSSYGALGPMQLMPQTAFLMQKKMNGGTLSATDAAMDNVAEPILNITLGQHYVEHLLSNELVEGNLFYLLAAYNAGPGRLQEWKARMGQSDDPLLFVESIPYAQTRNYVMQVMTNYWIYSELLGTPNRSVYALLHGQWPSYEQYTGPVADIRAATATPPG